MDKTKIAAYLAELIAVGDEPMCLSCHCYLNVLRQVRDDIGARGLEDLPESALLDTVMARSEVAQPHDCLGCDPCLPVAPFNELNELFRQPVGESPNCSCPGDCSTKTDSATAPPPIDTTWPPLPGNYRVLDPNAQGTICTLSSVDLFEAVAVAAPTGVAIVGSMVTENLGIERLVGNLVTSPAVSWLLLCGLDSKGHRAGESLLALSRNGVDSEMRVVGASGQRARLQNLTLAEIEAFRRRVSLIPHVGVMDPSEVLAIASTIEVSSDVSREGSATIVVRQLVERVSGFPVSPRDPAGYFVIDVLSELKALRLEHYANDHRLTAVLEGENARDLYIAAIRKELLSQLDHAAYLGRELGRAEDAMRSGRHFTQDE